MACQVDNFNNSISSVSSIIADNSLFLIFTLYLVVDIPEYDLSKSFT